MLRLIPAEPAERAVRLRRQLMALYSYLLLLGGAFIGVQLAAFEPDTPLLLLLELVLAANLIFFVIIRTGLSERFSDPSMTIAQMLSGLILTTILLYYTRELRGAMISIYFMVMTFGVFSLSRQRMVVMAVLALLCFTVLEAYEWTEAPQQAIFTLMLGHWVILALGLTWFIYMGGYIHNLQTRVREQREHLREAHARLSAIAIRDELTGLYNRRHFLERLDKELALSNRKHTELRLAIIDLDHFKRINDSYGHQAGDEVLRRFASIAQASLRKSDLLARYGGEEFVVLLPQTSETDSLAALRRLGETFANQRYDFAPDVSVTFSAGLALHQPDEPGEALAKRADMALYQAKHRGRNQVVVDDTTG
ncbi:MAG: GGDEF domain-containing protein [Alcanivorax sp.]|nr:GGDEF domain-containing protein [Alcanivorax sp.]